MKRWTALVAISLCGCGLTEQQRDQTEDIAYDSAADAIAESKRINALEARIDDLEAKLAENALAAASRPQAPVRDRTAELALKAQLKQMSADGVCGQGPIRHLPNGGVLIPNKECTEADLR